MSQDPNTTMTLQQWEEYAAELTAQLIPQPLCIVQLDATGKIIGRLTVQKEVLSFYPDWIDVGKHDVTATHLQNGVQVKLPIVKSPVQLYLEALPDIRDQLDAIWVHLAKSRNSLPPETQAMLARVEAAHAKKPPGVGT